jgi:hypothetical protein
MAMFDRTSGAYISRPILARRSVLQPTTGSPTTVQLSADQFQALLAQAGTEAVDRAPALDAMRIRQLTKTLRDEAQKIFQVTSVPSVSVLPLDPESDTVAAHHFSLSVSVPGDADLGDLSARILELHTWLATSLTQEERASVVLSVEPEFPA